MKYRAEIDGLRSVAVIPVVLFHAGFEIFSGGFVGVDVFFVISGYLITSIIINELRETGTLSIKNFYERRIRRIIPALITVVLISSLIAFLVLLPDEFGEFSKSALSAIFFVSNIYFSMERDYFAGPAELEPLLHTWSLAVEEQFYILVPVITLFLWRAGYKFFVSAIVIFMVLSFVLAVVLVYRDPNVAFYNLATRAWELQIGALCALFLQGRERMSQPVAAAAGLAAILLSVFFIDKHTPYPSHYTLPTVIGTACVILFCNGKDITSKILSTPALVGLGLISYSTYLWHQPVFAFARHAQLDSISTRQTLGLIALSVALAFATWKLIEQPFRSKRRISTPTLVKSVASSSIVLLMGFGAVLTFPHHYENIWILAQDNQTRRTLAVLETAKHSAEMQKKIRVEHPQPSCQFKVRDMKRSTKKKILNCYKKLGPGIAILGDSHAANLFEMFLSRYDHSFVVGITRGGCRAHQPNTYCSYDDFSAFIKKYKNTFSLVIYEQAGFYLLQNENGKQVDRYTFTSVGLGEETSGLQPHRNNILGVAEYLDKLAGSTRTIWFGPRMEPHITRKMILNRGCDYLFHFRKNQKETFEKLDKFLVTNSSKRKFEYTSQLEMMSLKFPQDFMNCSETYWQDGDHYSTKGIERFAKRLSLDLER